MSRILIINPNTTVSMTQNILEAARRGAAAGSTISAATPTCGVASVESAVDEVWASAGVIELIELGETQGVDAYVIACFGDVGLAAARELASGPVVGMTEAALMTACLLGHRSAIITMPRRTRVQSDRVVRQLGLEHRCVVRAIDEPVESIHESASHLIDAIADEGRLAIEHDDAEVIVLGCAGLAELVGPLQAALRVPVVEGVAAAVSMAEGLLAQGLRTSRANTFAAPDRRRPAGR